MVVFKSKKVKILLLIVLSMLLVALAFEVGEHLGEFLAQ